MHFLIGSLGIVGLVAFAFGEKAAKALVAFVLLAGMLGLACIFHGVMVEQDEWMRVHTAAADREYEAVWRCQLRYGPRDCNERGERVEPRP
jgi:hypothetical protein